jgi:uncharacterized protein YkwD
MSKREEAAFKLVNDFRHQHGLNRLRVSAELNRKARGQAETMRKEREYNHDGFDHRAKGWAHMWENVGVVWPASLFGARRMVRWWKNSPPHRADMLAEPANKMGIGENGGYWCLDLGRK